jgi:hypothetical protein
MVYDNRYFPLYPQNYSRRIEKKTYTNSDIFFMLGHSALRDEDEVISIPEIWSVYDLKKLADAAVLLGLPDVLSPDFTQLSEIFYNTSGGIDAQGIAFGGEQRLSEYISVGGNFFFMHVFNRISFALSDEIIRRYSLTEDQIILLDQRRRELQTLLGFTPTQFSKTAFSDIDLYLRVGKIWEYCLKFKKIDFGVSGGLLINTGYRKNINNPASLPFGGDGFFGVYANIELEVEVKEDWIGGLQMQFSQRFSRTSEQRIPINNEQPLFGAAVGDLKIKPGFTFIFAPYARVEDIRDGLGGQVGYTAVIHLKDGFTDKRSSPTPPATFNALEKFSAWNSEYVNIYIFYDFARVRKPYWYAPLVQLRWDLPTSILVAKNVSKTQRFSLGCIMSF